MLATVFNMKINGKDKQFNEFSIKVFMMVTTFNFLNKMNILTSSRTLLQGEMLKNKPCFSSSPIVNR